MSAWLPHQMAAREGEIAVRDELSLLGVIDLRDGQAVHAIAGDRAAYRPLRIAPCPDADPVALAEHYRSLGVAGLYVADLDRIVDRSNASQEALSKLLATGLPIWIDRGLQSAAGWDEADESLPPEATWIVGTETLRSLDELHILADRVGSRSAAETAPALAVSLDLRDGRVVSPCGALAGSNPWRAAQMLATTGIQRLIVLDVARVGTGAGPSTAPLCGRIRRLLPEMKIISGGGVRGPEDAAALIAAGCDGVLAGTWLHAIPRGRRGNGGADAGPGSGKKRLTSAPNPR